MINVVIHHRLSDEYLRQLASVSPQVRIRVGLPGHDLPAASAPTTEFPPADILDLLPEADVLYTFKLPDGLLERAPRLKWIQVASAGVDRILEAGLLDAGPIVTTSSGIHAIPIGEYVMAALLSVAHRFPQAARQQIEHRWQGYISSELSGKVLGIVGYGQIGRHIAKLALAFDMRVIATRRSAERSTVEETAGGVELVPPTELPSLLARSDYAVVAVPLVPATTHLIGAEELAAMKPTGYLVNVSRGKVVDQDALVRALADGRIAGACLDVFDEEPLPTDSPLWDMPNVIVTPHSAGNCERYDERAVALFRQNLARYVAGRPLINVVDSQRGY